MSMAAVPAVRKAAQASMKRSRAMLEEEDTADAQINLQDRKRARITNPSGEIDWPLVPAQWQPSAATSISCHFRGQQ